MLHDLQSVLGTDLQEIETASPTQYETGSDGCYPRQVQVELITDKWGEPRVQVGYPIKTPGADKMTLESYAPDQVARWALRVATTIGIDKDLPLVFARLKVAEEEVKPMPNTQAIEEAHALVADLWDDDHGDLLGMLLRRLEETLQFLRGQLRANPAHGSKVRAKEFEAKTSEGVQKIREAVKERFDG